MRNPWIKKNPFMSVWLSGANKVLGSARGVATAQAKRTASKAAKDGIALATQMWGRMLTPATGARKRKPRS